MSTVVGPGRVSLDVAIADYVELNPRSRAHFERAVGALAGGTTRTTVFFEPYPPVLVRGEGCWVVDLDGNRRLDFLNNYTSLILGHADPGVVAAVTEQAQRGTAFAAPTENELRLAELICMRVPSVERLRFANSGTEATLFAMRLARAFTGRDKVLVMEGGYHGTHDYAAFTSSAGIPQAVRGTMVSAPFNDLAAVSRVVDEAGADLAAIIVEPVLGAAGVLPAKPEFLRGLRDLATANGSLLIFDEVISLRVAPGGAQDHRRRVPCRRLWRPRRRHGPARPTWQWPGDPARRHVQRQSRRDHRGHCHAGSADARGLRAAECVGRAAAVAPHSAVRAARRGGPGDRHRLAVQRAFHGRRARRLHVGPSRCQRSESRGGTGAHERWLLPRPARHGQHLDA